MESPGKALESGEIDLAIGVFDNLLGGFHETPLGRESVCLPGAQRPPRGFNPA
jgi:DNA-binding transcriptional LysR family regulator